MKKLVSVLFVALLVGGMAFAADPVVKVGGWGRVIFNAAESTGQDGADVLVGVGPSWAKGSRVRADISGTSDNFGFLLQLFFHGGTTFASPDNAKIWWKANDMFRLTAGRFKGDTLRGKIGDSDMINTTDGDFIFERMEPVAGAMAEITPMKELYIAAAVDTDTTDYAETASNVYQKVQAGAGYTIDKVGLIRAQYVGKWASKAINVAFAYTGMAGLVVDAGIFIPTAETATNKMSIGASVSYSKDAIAAVVRTYTLLADTLGFRASADLSYVVANPLSAGVELQYAKDVSVATQTVATSVTYTNLFTVAPYAKMAYGNGYMKAGFVANVGMSSGDKLSWSIPVILTYSF
ncbi:MAG: hypothetical protein WCT14_09250 [Treponemataceae bacterium]